MKRYDFVNKINNAVNVAQHTMVVGMGTVALLNIYQGMYMADKNAYKVAAFTAFASVCIESMKFLETIVKNGKEEHITQSVSSLEKATNM
ncbi:MAG: hypothetical protein AABX11_00810 [Nanoarchaeota archaeon]